MHNIQTADLALVAVLYIHSISQLTSFEFRRPQNSERCFGTDLMRDKTKQTTKLSFSMELLADTLSAV